MACCMRRALIGVTEFALTCPKQITSIGPPLMMAGSALDVGSSTLSQCYLTVPPHFMHLFLWPLLPNHRLTLILL